MNNSTSLATVPITNWWLFQRVCEVESAFRINVIRLIGLVLFYAVQVWVYFSHEKPDAATIIYHKTVSWTCGTWLVLAVLVMVAIWFRSLPPMVKYMTTVSDAVLLTYVAAVGGKATGGAVVIYFLIIAMTYLRFSKPLVIVATVTSLAGYLSLVGMSDPVWFDQDHVVPIKQQASMMIGLILTGAVGWQICQIAENWFATQAQLSDQRSQGRSLGEADG